MFALAFMSIMVIIGFGIDYGRLQTVHSSAQAAADSAALYGVHLMDEESDNLKPQLKKVFKTNLSEDFSVDELKFDAVRGSDGEIIVTASGRVETVFMQVIDKGTMHFSVKATASGGVDTGAEIVIAIDATNSMGSVWNDAQDVLETSLNGISQYTGEDNFFVTLLPFQDRVSIGRAEWLSGPAPSGWEGCYEPREEMIGSRDWALDDDRPTSDRFDASIAGVTGGLANLPGHTLPACPHPIVGPTNNVSLLIDAADDLDRDGTGRMDVGLAWAWRLVSPNWSGMWNIPNYPANSAKKRRKVILFITDGLSSLSGWEMEQDPHYKWNHPTNEFYNHLSALCDDIKGQDIEIWTVLLPGNSEALPHYRDCSTENRFYEGVDTTSELEIVFQELEQAFIGDIRLTN